MDLLTKWMNHLMQILTNVEYDMHTALDAQVTTTEKLTKLQQVQDQLRSNLPELRKALAYSSKVCVPVFLRTALSYCY